MKKLVLTATLAMGLFAISATNPAIEKPEVKSEENQLRVSAQDVINYLTGAPHYHWACCAELIPGTSNWTAQIEEGGTATVYVSNGIIVNHADANSRNQ